MSKVIKFSLILFIFFIVISCSEEENYEQYDGKYPNNIGAENITYHIYANKTKIYENINTFPGGDYSKGVVFYKVIIKDGDFELHQPCYGPTDYPSCHYIIFLPYWVEGLTMNYDEQYSVVTRDNHEGGTDLYETDSCYWEYMVRLTDDPVFARSPSFNPQYTTIAFLSARDSNYTDELLDIYLIDKDGETEENPAQRLTINSLRIIPPLVWSPDGTKIAFTVKDEEGDYHICYIPSTGGELTEIETDVPSPHLYDYSPDGNWIAIDYEYVYNNRLIRRIGYIPSSGGDANPFFQPILANCYNPLFFPQGDEIVFISEMENSHKEHDIFRYPFNP